jgi:hypothetical protein
VFASVVGSGVICIGASTAGVGTKKLAPGSLFAEGMVGLLYDGAPKAFPPPPPPPLLNVSTYLHKQGYVITY